MVLLIFLGGLGVKGWAGSARVAVFVNLERLPGFEVTLMMDGVYLLKGGRAEKLPLKSEEVKTGVSFAQKLLAFGEVPEGKYEGMRLYISGVGVGGRLEKREIEREFPVSFEVHKGETISLFLTWDVAGSIGAKAFVPRFSVRVQESPLPGENLFVATEDTDTVWVITTDTNRVVYSLGIGDGPQGMAVDPDRERFYVVCKGERAVKVVGRRSFRVEDVIPVPLMNSPRYIALGPEGMAFLTSPGDRMVAILDLERGNLVRYRRLSYEPQEVTYIERVSRFAVSSPDDSAVYLFDRDLTPVKRLSAGFRPRGVNADEKYLYVSDEQGGLHLYRLPDFQSEGRVEVCSAPVRVLAVERRIFVSCEDGWLDVILAGHKAVSRRLTVGRGAFAMAYYSPRRWLYVALREAGAVAVVDFNRERTLGNITVGGRPFEMVVGTP